MVTLFNIVSHLRHSIKKGTVPQQWSCSKDAASRPRLFVQHKSTQSATWQYPLLPLGVLTTSGRTYYLCTVFLLMHLSLSLLFWHLLAVRKTVSGFCSNLNMYAMRSSSNGGASTGPYSFVFTIHARLTTAWLLRL